MAFSACRPALGQERGAGLRGVTQLPSKEKRWALIVGVDDYGNGLQKLYGAVNDSKALKDALVKYANFPEEQVVVLSTGGNGEQPTRTNILSRLFRLKERIPKDGLFLFAFSGHGVERNGKVFLLPSDALQTRDFDELGQLAIAADTITEQIKRAEIRQVLMLLDACRNDPEAGKGDKDNVLTEAFRRGFSFDTQNRNIEAFATLYATSFGKRAYEFRDKESGLQRGFFTWALVKGLEGGAADANGEVTLGGLVGYIAEAVPRKLKAENVGGEQVPYPLIGGYNADELVLALSAKGPAGGAVAGARTYFDRGRALQAEGKFDEAIKEYERAVSLNPRYGDAYEGMGDSYDAKGDYDRALKYFDKVIELKPRDAAGYDNRGDVYFKKGLYEKAITNYGNVIELSPRDNLAFVNRGKAYYKNGDSARALKDYDEALRINPGDGAAYFNRGLAYDDAGRYDEALRDYTEAIALAPDNLEAHYKRARVYGVKGDLVKAITDLSVYLTFKPQDDEALCARAALYNAKRNYRDALADLEKAIKLKPGRGDAYVGRGDIYAALGEDAKALADYNKAIEIDPKDAGALTGRGTLYEGGGQYEQALADFERAVAADPEDFLGYFRLGSFYIQRGNLARANENFKRMKGLLNVDALARNRQPGDLPGKASGRLLPPGVKKSFEHMAAGISFLTEKEFGKAADEFDKAIKETPQFTELYQMRGLTHYLDGNNDAAVADAKLLLAFNPEDVAAYSLQGDAYAGMGDYRQAVASYTEVIRLSPKNAQAYRARADAYEMLGNGSKAKADRQRADALEGRQVNR